MLSIWAALIVGSLQATPELDALVTRDSRPTLVTGGFRFGEGPVWTRDGRLIWSDILGDTIYQLKDGKAVPFIKPAQRSIGNALDPQGRLVSCHQQSRSVTRREKNGSVTVLADKFEGKKFNSPDDVIVRSDGSIYFTDPSFGLKDSDRQLAFDGVYRISPAGKVELLAKDFAKPNGLAFSPDEKRLYINDLIRHQIRVFDVSPTGSLSNDRQFAVLFGEQDGLANGMKVDVKGNVWCTAPGGIQVFAASGKFLGKIYQREIINNFCFGGPDKKTLFIVTARQLFKLPVKVAGAR